MITRHKGAIFFVLTAFLVSATNLSQAAVNTSDIDQVRDKELLDSKDFQTIDDFVAVAVGELCRTADFTSVAKERMVIVSRKSSNKQSAHIQYAGQFYKSAYKYISSGLDDASRLTPEDRQFKTVLNLLILMDNLADVRLADLGVRMLNDKKPAIRYWAVHSLTNISIIEQLSSGKAADLELARRIIAQLKGLVEGSGPEIVTLMVEFAGELNIKEAEELLLEIAEMRMGKYADWTVDYTPLDATVLKALYKKMSSTGANKPVIAQHFAQLYSYTIQRYIRNINGGGFLDDTQKQQLASVLAETEKACISKLLEMAQAKIRKAIEQDDYATLTQEHNDLLGDETKAGRLASKLNFDYGKTADGNRRTAPLALPEQPKTK